MSKRISPNEMKHIVHEMEYAKSRSFYAEQNRRMEAKAVYEAQMKAYRDHENSMNSSAVANNYRGTTLSGNLGASIIVALLLSTLNEFVSFVDVSFLKFFFVSLPIIFLVGLFKS